MPAPLPIGPVSEAWLGDKSVPPELGAQWTENGCAVMRGVYGADQIRAYNQIVAAVRQEVDNGRFVVARAWPAPGPTSRPATRQCPQRSEAPL